MTKTLKNRLAVMLMAVLVVVTGCFMLSVFGNSYARADVFTNTAAVTVTKEQSLSQTFLGGKKGYMLSTNRNGASIELEGGCAGKFNIEFTPYSATTGENEFNSFKFKFSSEKVRLGFTLEFAPSDNGVKMSVSFTNVPLITREVLFDGSFNNTSDKAIAFSFDPDLMRVYNAVGDVIADFQSAEYMKNFEMATLIESYEKYSVSMTFSGITAGKTAKVIVYEVNGQKLDKATLENTSAPIIFKDVEFSSAVMGKAYTLNTDIETYDVKDGFKSSFDGDVVVTDSKNASVTLTDNVFIPSEYGVYYANFTPVDSDGLKGKTYTYPIYVFETQPEVEFNFQYPIEDVAVGKGTELSFGAITAQTQLASGLLMVSGVITNGQNEVYKLDDCGNGFKYTFNENGTYTVTFKATDAVGYSSEVSVSVEVTDTAVFKNIDLKDVYAKDSSVSFNSVYALSGSNMITAKALVTYPNGRTNDSGAVLLDEEGVYKVEFSANVGGATVKMPRYFTVKNDNATLWEVQDGLTVTSNAKAPDYADDDYCGTMLTATRPIEAVYENVIDISDNTQDNTLIELFVAPTIAGVLETSRIDVILTDIYNPENVIDICLTRDAWLWDSMRDRISIIAQPKRDFDIAYLNDINTTATNYQQYYYYAQSVFASLFGKIENSNETSVSQSFKLFFNYQTGELYANLASKGSNLGKIVVADLSDEKYVGSGKAWKKFTTGEAKLSIKISGLSQTANVMVLNIDDQEMAGTHTVDTTAPSIFIDYAGNSEKSIPFGIKGKPYKIFSAYSRDIAEGQRKDITVKVYKNEGGILMDVENNGSEFIPQTTGEYVIRYSTADAAGNSSVKDVVVIVKNDSEIAPKNYIFSELLSNQAAVGTEYKYFVGTAKGGSGALTTSMTITKGGEQVTLDENNAFKIDSVGEYVISVVVSDYIGQSQPFTFVIDADYSADAVMQKRTLPKAIILNEEYTFPEFSAVKYTANGEEEVPVEFFVNGVKLDGNKYTPTTTDTLDVQVKAGNTVLNYDIGVTTSAAGRQFIARYLYTNATPNVIERSATFTFSESAFVSIIKPASADFINFTVASEAAKGILNEQEVSYKPGDNLSRIDFTLTDSVDPDIKFTASLIKKNSAESYLEYNGVKYIVVDAIFTSYAKNFQVEFDSQRNMIIIGGRDICEVTHCDNGDVFHGFTSGYAYLDFTMPEVENEGLAAIGVVTFAGQNFDVSKTSTKSRPTVKVLGDFDTVEVGEEFTIPAAIAFDFMNEVKSVTVTVTAPDGSALLNNVDISEVKTVTANMCGNYKIVYVAKNKINAEGKKTFTVNVLDRVVPEITLSGSVQEAAVLNSIVILPTMTVSDDNTNAEDIITYIYCIAPNGQWNKVENNRFTADKKGTYMVVYYASDSDNAIAIKTFSIVVK